MRKNNNKIAIIDGTLSKDKVFIKKKKKKKKCIGDKFLCTLNTSVQYDGSHFY